MKRVAVLISLVVLARPAAAQPTPEEVAAEITDNVSTEFVECGAYFSIAEGAFARDGNHETAQKLRDASDRAIAIALMTAQQNRSKEMAEKVTLARFQSDMDDMGDVIGNNYGNMSLLNSKYVDRCIEALNDSASVMRRWGEKIMAKYQLRQNAEEQ